MLDLISNIICAILGLIGTVFAFKAYIVLKEKALLTLFIFVGWASAVRILRVVMLSEEHPDAITTTSILIIVTYALAMLTAYRIYKLIQTWVKEKGVDK